MPILDTLLADARAQFAPEPPRSAYSDLLRAAFFSPGFQVLTLWRVAARLYSAGPISRQLAKPLLWCKAIMYGCYINPSASLARGIVLPHPVGIVIGQGVRVGRGTMIYQHVTLGVARVADPAYPSIGREVILYAGSVVAGAVEIGDRSWIGANAVVVKDVPSESTAVGNPAVVRPRRTSTAAST